MSTTLIDLDPRELAAHPSNIRTDLGDLEELRDSLTGGDGIGLLQPIIVTPAEGGYRILAGHRRTAAAIEAGLDTVTCLVRDDLAELAPEQIAAMLAENLHRKELTPSEEATGYAQLAAFDGWTPQRIARATGVKPARVEQSLTLHALPEAAHAAADRGDLDLDDAAALRAFDGDEKTLARILAKGSTWGIRHAIGDETRKRQSKAAMAAVQRELADTGVKVIKRPKDYPWASREAAAATLLGEHGNPLNPDEVKTKPGFAAIIETPHGGGEPVVTVVCVDPEAWGYQRTRHTSYVDSGEAARRGVEEQAEQTWRADLDAARQVRHEFIAHTLGSAKTIKTLRLDVLRDLLSEPHLLALNHGDPPPLYATLAGADPDGIGLAAAGESRLTRMLTARWVMGHERNLDDCATDRRWRAQPALGLAWLDRLTQAGYELAPAEATLRERLHAQLSDADEQDTWDGEVEELPDWPADETDAPAG